MKVVVYVSLMDTSNILNRVNEW